MKRKANATNRGYNQFEAHKQMPQTGDPIIFIRTAYALWSWRWNRRFLIAHKEKAQDNNQSKKCLINCCEKWKMGVQRKLSAPYWSLKHLFSQQKGSWEISLLIDSQNNLILCEAIISGETMLKENGYSLSFTY